jgi:uncharacterized membrane protein
MADINETVERLVNTPDSTASYDPEDARRNMAMAILAYLSWLVLIPLFLAKNSKFARFHCNQGLILAILETICWVVLGILGGLPLLGWIFRLINGVLGVVFLLYAILGIVNAVNGRAKELPVIGSFRVLR